eukprot:GCRY01003807.1.p1 GENE.GCRY01003807.1~~GCRY01003807.1.p1  ORF type:complete len:409 (+),score=63.43 GCRY01003807.1:67-1227(+)
MQEESFIPDEDIDQELELECDEHNFESEEDDEDIEVSSDEEEEEENRVYIDQSRLVFKGHKDFVVSLAISPTESLCASGAGDDQCLVWNYESGHVAFSVSDCKDTVSAVKFNHDGSILAVGGMDGTLVVYKVSSHEKVYDLETPGAEIMWLEWHQKGNVLMAGFSDSSVWIYAPNGSVMNYLYGHSDVVHCGLFSPSGKLAITCSQDGSIRAWDPKTARCTRTFADIHPEGATQVAVKDTAGKTTILTGGCDGDAHVFSLESGREIGRLSGHQGNVEAIGFCNSAAHPYAATGSLDNNLRIWDMNTFSVRHTMTLKGGVNRVVWHPCDPVVACADGAGVVSVVDARTGQFIAQWTGHEDVISELLFSKDGNAVLTASEDSTCRVFY